MRGKLPKKWTTLFKIVDRTLVIRFAHSRRVISSAAHCGGVVRAHGIINHQVVAHSTRSNQSEGIVEPLQDPSWYLGKLGRGLGLKGRFVGLMTVVDIRTLVVKREEATGMWVEGFFTVGVTNAIRAGEPTHHGFEMTDMGTINIILVTNARLSLSAMVGAVGVATESKTAVLLEEGIKSCNGPFPATGTGTDVVAIATGDGPNCRYSGTHTKIGELIGRVVSYGVKKGLQRDRAWRSVS